ncbi:MAG: hypothetical protein NBKEAIPA_02513 [Nitrospirae bacterium]|nr:MAG: Nickel uptake substrate-specific transmembrane region [Nitrospira sp. OLB3]MBV6470597.1 hypothetical protein [Nitrospirota bacterium]MCE7965415.1 DUF4198 domain-containing protein [Nitrospira sp. NTP2]MCK6493041.1 DUF4198 domain-containing protein [Nitrospira sp.]MEB2338388.1 DUF4198 domain-containing protein [Nitrospirales bacterium]
MMGTRLMFGLWSIVAMGSGVIASPAGAHFVWVETEATASADAGLPLKIYFGEYAELLREERGGRLDQIDGVTLRVQHAKQGRTDVSLTKQINHFAGSLSACTPGPNAVLAEQAQVPVQDLRKYDIGVVKPMFYARTSFLCVEEGRINEHERGPVAPMDLDLIPLTKGLSLATGRMTHAPGGEIVVKAVFKGKPLPNTQVLVHAPNGWDKELKSDAEGILAFTPLWPGRYVLEVVQVEPTPGEFQGKPYEAVRHRSTLSLQVKAERSRAE